MFRRMVWISSGVKEDGFAELEDYAEAYGKSACVRALNILIGKEFEMRQNLRADIILETAVNDADGTRGRCAMRLYGTNRKA